MEESRAQLDRVRQNLQVDLQKLRPAYEQACQAFRTEQTSLMASMLHIHTVLGQYRPGDDPHKSVYIVAECYVKLGKLVKPFQVIQEYETKQKKLEAWDIEQRVTNG